VCVHTNVHATLILTTVSRWREVQEVDKNDRRRRGEEREEESKPIV